MKFENLHGSFFFSKKYLEIWSMILFAKGLREVVSHPRIDTVLVLTGVCWHWPECHIFFAKSESSNEGYDRGNRNNWILGIRIDNSVTWHRLNFRSFGLSIAVVSVFWFWVSLYNCYFATENVFFLSFKKTSAAADFKPKNYFKTTLWFLIKYPKGDLGRFGHLQNCLIEHVYKLFF